MIERYPQAPTDIRKPRRIDPPDPAGQPHRALELQIGGPKPGRPATGLEHRAVEPGIVRNQELSVAQQRPDLAPNFPEARLHGHIFPGYAVDPGIIEGRPRRADQMRGLVHDPRAPHLDDPDRAGAVMPVIGGLEVDGNER